MTAWNAPSTSGTKPGFTVSNLRLPGWLQPVAEHNPFTSMVDAARALFLDAPAGNDVWLAVVWSIVIALVFGLLAVWRFRRVVAH